MHRSRIHIIQFLGVVVLLCCYFIGNQPDRLSVMHFGTSHSQKLVFSKGVKNHSKHSATETTVSHRDNKSRKTNIPQYIPLDILMPRPYGYTYVEASSIIHSCALPEEYSYQFFEEINPPPPKC